MILLDRVTKIITPGVGSGPYILTRRAQGVCDYCRRKRCRQIHFVQTFDQEEKPSSGKIIVGSMDYDKLRDQDIPLLRRKIGVVFQDFKLLSDRTVRENVAFALEIAGLPTVEIRHTVPKVLDVVGLTGKENNYPRELSGGEAQRVAIARAIVRQPKILIADEPTGNLDPKNAFDVIKVLEKINRFGTTVLLTTHNQEIVNYLKRRVVTIKDGKIISDRAGGKYKL